jgi:membrane protein DedA with SNARE-associated domain
MKDLIHHYGAWIVFVLVFLESIGLPLPGEAILVSAAIFAGTTHDLNIALILLLAVPGAVFGSIIGFWIGDRGCGSSFLRALWPSCVRSLVSSRGQTGCRSPVS